MRVGRNPKRTDRSVARRTRRRTRGRRTRAPPRDRREIVLGKSSPPREMRSRDRPPRSPPCEARGGAPPPRRGWCAWRRFPFAGRRPPRRRDDRETSRIAPSTVARRGARGRTRTREATRDLRTCSASATPSRASPRLSVPFEARRSWVSWRVSSRRPATRNRRWARGRENVARRWRVGARRRREPPRTEAISWTTEAISWTPSRASRLFLRPSSGFPPRREWRSRSIASRREASAAGLPRRARRHLSNYPILCVRRPPPRPSRGASTRAPRVAARPPLVAPACARGTCVRVLPAGVVSPPRRATTETLREVVARVATPRLSTTRRDDPRRRPRQPPRRETAPPPLEASWARPRRGRRVRAR